MIEFRAITESPNPKKISKPVEFAWLAIFNATLALIGAVIMINGFIKSLNSGEIMPYVGFVVIIIPLVSIVIILYIVGINLWMECRNNGKLALNRFRKQMEKGELPQLSRVKVLRHKNNEKYTYFTFDRGLFRVEIDVIISFEEFMNTKNIYKNSNIPFTEITYQNCITSNDELKTYLSEGEWEIIAFIKLLGCTQHTRIRDL